MVENEYEKSKRVRENRGRTAEHQLPRGVHRVSPKQQEMVAPAHSSHSLGFRFVDGAVRYRSGAIYLHALLRGRSTVRRTWLKKLGLAGGATVIAFVLCEIAARLLYPAPPDPTREPQIQYQGDADVGYGHVPNQQGWIDDGWVTINSLGLRGPEPAMPKPKGLFRFMVLGDSCTVGWGVNDDETFCSVLERLLCEAYPGRQFEVINCGVAGYDTQNEERQLKRLAPLFQPDFVLVTFFHNDLPHNGLTPDGDKGVEQIISPKPGQIFRMVPRRNWLNRTLRQSRAIYCIKDSMMRMKNTGANLDMQAAWELALLDGKRSSAIEEAWRAEEEILKRMRSLANSYKCPIGLMASPCREQVRQDYPNARYQSKVKEIGDRLGILVVDPLPLFIDRRGQVSELFIPYDRYHASAAGHRLIGQSLFDFLKNNLTLAKN